MSGIQWLLLILVIAAVAAAYWYLRRQGGDDPWQGLDEESGGGQDDRGESLGGDSYIVGVRTVSGGASSSAKTPADAGEAKPAPDKGRRAGRARTAGDDDTFWQAFHTEPAGSDDGKADSGVEEVRPQRPPAGEESLFVLHVASRDGSFLDGPDIHRALQDQKLKFGLHDIYHRITEVNGVPESVYSVANMLKPGFLDPVEQDHLRTPGLALFLVLPGPIEGTRAMRDMLDTARALAEDLGGEVLDDKRSLLTNQTAQYMLDQVAELDRRQRVRAGR